MRPRLRLLYAYRVTVVVLQRYHRLSQELSIKKSREFYGLIL